MNIQIIFIHLAQTTNTDSDRSDDETIPDEKRYNTGAPHSDSILTTSPTWDDSDHTSPHLSPLLDRLFLIKL
jgi:hypothetical protein